ncbi:MAG: mannitol-1-phosphate 5-dehydrogenase [Buchnera aphidicola (Pentalonia nigronervosa)]|jgi:mannitol-1-phosphate 5-dehydrogenase|uniref:Mannitol-1-phosphate 5-dehydrogenase n=1 Tax=Buchnera aphidicola (Pentalonia nigronervosa) TaxID=1309793 RepID=A0A7H1AZ31_9GAMM|nr:MAG: mannitol-1-phosphate 5-dehydrogenase [Buchnera aphidicola (Pentalonia nigronervosa)]
MKALHFGAGNIGRGFIGKNLFLSGFDVIFSDINKNIINAINYYKEYNVQLVNHNQENNTQHDIINVRNIRAIHAFDSKIDQIISVVNLITTSVGPNAINKIASIIMRGIILRAEKKSIIPLNVIACENRIQSSSYLKACVLNQLPMKYRIYCDKYIGFIDCTVDTIIPISQKQNDSNLFLLAEKFQEWIVDANQFKGKIPKIVNMQLSDNLIPFVIRKLFTLNTGHAIAAYLGLTKKYETIQESIEDKIIQNIVKLGMQESGSVLVKHYHFNQNDHTNYIKTIFYRFKNPLLSDNLNRIARNPLQKLHPKERLIRPLLGAIKYNLPYLNLIKGIAAAFRYRSRHDEESKKIALLIKKTGIKQTLLKICQFKQRHTQEINLIIQEYNNIF